MYKPIRKEFMWKLVENEKLSTKKWDYAVDLISQKEQMWDVWRKKHNEENWEYIGIWRKRQP